MEDFPHQCTLGYEERIARAVWAAHMLSYLTKKRWLIELLQLDAAEEGEGFGCDKLDAEAEKNGKNQESIRSNFLDSICPAVVAIQGLGERHSDGGVA